MDNWADAGEAPVPKLLMPEVPPDGGKFNKIIMGWRKERVAQSARNHTNLNKSNK